MSTLKNRVLEILELNRGRSVSGSAAAEQLGVTRSAVWKTVEALRREGYVIESATNSGYMLSRENDKLSAEGIRVFLSESRRKMRIICLDETDSTNSEAKRITAAEKEPLLIAANSQTAGRGRMGRSFYSPGDTGLYMTLALDTGERVEDAVKLTCAASVAVVRAIEELTDVRPGIKWVNDVFVGDKKVCGILTEGLFDLETGRMARVLVGIGINVSTEVFPPGIHAASLNCVRLKRNRLAARVTDELMDITEGKKDWLDCYRARSVVIGRDITYVKNGISVSARAIGVEQDGGLLVINENNERSVLKSGEISVRLEDSRS